MRSSARLRHSQPPRRHIREYGGQKGQPCRHAAANHPLAHAKSVPATIFEREPYIEIHTGLQTDNTLCFRSRGIVPKLSFSTPDSIIACGMVKAGLGVALVNSVIADELQGGVAYVPLDPPENVDICVITPAREVISPAAKSFAAYAMGFMSQLFLMTLFAVGCCQHSILQHR